jgi:hypothetical protein
MNYRAGLAALLIVTSVSACEAVNVEGDFDRICSNFDARRFAGTREPALVQRMNFGVKPGDEPPPFRVEAARLLNLILVRRDGVPDLGFIDHLEAKLVSRTREGSVPDVFEIGSYTRFAAPSSAGLIEILSTGPEDIARFMNGESDLELALRGRMPISGWTADVIVCVAATAKGPN